MGLVSMQRGICLVNSGAAQLPILTLRTPRWLLRISGCVIVEAVQRFPIAFGVLIFGVCGASASAYADGEKALSVGLGYATYSTPGEAPQSGEPPPTLTPTAGAGIRASYEWAFTSDLSIRGSLAGGGFFGGGLAGYGEAAAGVTLRFDVLKYVPYAYAQIGGVVRGGGQIDTGVDPVLCLGGGLDILTRRDLSWGIEGQMSSYAGDFSVFTLGIRGTTRWDFF
jgi:hypothetical protein